MKTDLREVPTARWLLLTMLVMGMFVSAAVDATDLGTTESSSVADAAEFDAGEAVAGFHVALIETMQATDQKTREQIIRPHIENLFDTRGIAAISLGRTWRTLTDVERLAFVDLLQELIVATYADRFDSFNEQKFVTLSLQDAKRGKVVRTQILRKSGDTVSLDYFFRGERIFNVVADGVSDLSLRRADYNSVVKYEGYPALLEHIRKKTTKAREEV